MSEGLVMRLVKSPTCRIYGDRLARLGHLQHGRWRQRQFGSLLHWLLGRNRRLDLRVLGVVLGDTRLLHLVRRLDAMQ